MLTWIMGPTIATSGTYWMVCISLYLETETCPMDIIQLYRITSNFAIGVVYSTLCGIKRRKLGIKSIKKLRNVIV